MSKNERTCISCGITATKAELFRWVNADSAILLDWQGRFPGRAVYTHPHPDCIKKLYERRSFPTRFLTGKRSFVTSFTDIFSHIHQLAEDSFRHFCSLSLKSGRIEIGQESISEKYELSTLMPGVVFLAHDMSEKSLKRVPEVVKNIGVTLPFSKEKLGSFLTGRPVGIVAVERGSLADRLSFYSEIMTRFFLGDVHADM